MSAGNAHLIEDELELPCRGLTSDTMSARLMDFGLPRIGLSPSAVSVGMTGLE